MSHYHDPSDRRYGAHLRRAAGPEFEAYTALNDVARREDGAVPLKYRELISVAVALTTQCAYCIETHVNAAHAAGATHEELAETTFIAAALRAGGAVAHGRMAMKLYEQASEAARVAS
jgi:AhpD family alkylhydroperoxidase